MLFLTNHSFNWNQSFRVSYVLEKAEKIKENTIPYWDRWKHLIWSSSGRKLLPDGNRRSILNGISHLVLHTDSLICKVEIKKKITLKKLFFFNKRLYHKEKSLTLAVQRNQEYLEVLCWFFCKMRGWCFHISHAIRAIANWRCCSKLFQYLKAKMVCITIHFLITMEKVNCITQNHNFVNNLVFLWIMCNRGLLG